MRGRIFAQQNLISEMSILSPLRVSPFLHSQDPQQTLGPDWNILHAWQVLVPLRRFSYRRDPTGCRSFVRRSGLNG